MKKLLLLVLVLGGLGVAGSYILNGRLPWVTLSTEEQQVASLREEFSTACQQWRQAGRAATFGMDTDSVTDAPLARLARVEASLTELTPTLKTSEARTKASRLRQDIAAFRREMR